MLDILILGALTGLFLAALVRRRRGHPGWAGLPVVSGILLLGFALWWYVLAPLVTG